MYYLLCTSYIIIAYRMSRSTRTKQLKYIAIALRHKATGKPGKSSLRFSPENFDKIVLLRTSSLDNPRKMLISWQAC